MEQELMTKQKKLDELANNYNKTKDPKYKKLWYDLVMHGTDNIKRRPVSTNSSNQEDVRWMELLNEIDCLDLCDILLKLTGYVDTLNFAHHERWQH